MWTVFRFLAHTPRTLRVIADEAGHFPEIGLRDIDGNIGELEGLQCDSKQSSERVVGCLRCRVRF